MPQTLYWRGTVNGSFTTLGNWITAAGATPGTALANGDTYIFDWGANDVTADLTTGFTGVTMIGTPGFSGRIAPGSTLSIASTAVRWTASGELNLTGNITAARIRCRRGSMFNYGGGTATDMFIEQSDYVIAAAAVITNARFNLSNGSDLANATAYTQCEINGGKHVTHRKGKFIVNNSASLSAKTGSELDDGTTVHSNSMLVYLSAEEVASGDVVTVWPGGVFDASGNQSFTWAGELAVWPGALVNLNTASGKVVPATETTYGLSDDVGGAIPK
jgi:hypothetical protein